MLALLYEPATPPKPFTPIPAATLALGTDCPYTPILGVVVVVPLYIPAITPESGVVAEVEVAQKPLATVADCISNNEFGVSVP